MYKNLQKLGDGVFGSVCKAIDEKTHEYVAIKTFRDNQRDENKIKEIQILKRLNHPNIIKLREVLKQNKQLSIVLEYSDRNLLQFYQQVKDKNRKLPELQIQSIVNQIASALSYLHSQGYMHRDLKPENIMIQDNGIVKLIDFGQVTYQNENHTDYVSTRWYRSPEQIKQEKYNQEIDIWAFGCIFAELYLMRPLIAGASDIDQLYQIQNLDFNKLRSEIPDEPLMIIKQMLIENPLMRITATEILQCEWLQNSYKYLPKELEKNKLVDKYLISPQQTPAKAQQYEDLDCEYVPSIINVTTTKKRQRIFNTVNEKKEEPIFDLTKQKSRNFFSKPQLQTFIIIFSFSKKIKECKHKKELSPRFEFMIIRVFCFLMNVNFLPHRLVVFKLVPLTNHQFIILAFLKPYFMAVNWKVIQFFQPKVDL